MPIVMAVPAATTAAAAAAAAAAACSLLLPPAATVTIIVLAVVVEIRIHRRVHTNTHRMSIVPVHIRNNRKFKSNIYGSSQ